MDKLEAARLNGMKNVALGIAEFSQLKTGMPRIEAYMFRAGEFQAAAVVFAAAGDAAMASAMNTMAATWLKIARDA